MNFRGAEQGGNVTLVAVLLVRDKRDLVIGGRPLQICVDLRLAQRFTGTVVGDVDDARLEGARIRSKGGPRMLPVAADTAYPQPTAGPRVRLAGFIPKLRELGVDLHYRSALTDDEYARLAAGRSS